MRLTAAAALASLLAGCALGWQLQAGRWAAADLERTRIDAESERLQRQSIDAAAARHEADRAQLAAQRRTITREVERVIVVEADAAAAVCLGPSGLRAVADAAAGRDPGQPAAAVPGPDAAR